MAITTIKGIKDLKWDKIKLSGEGFDGAVMSYTNSKGKKVALCFNTSEAFIVEDNLGLFDVKDLYSGVIRAKNIDIEATGHIVGAKTVAFMDEDTMKVMLIPDEVERLYLTEEVTNDIKSRVENLYGFLTRMIDII